MQPDVAAELEVKGQRAREASRALIEVLDHIDAALLAMADALTDATDDVLAENAKDLNRARSEGMSESMLDRLTLTPERIRQISEGIRQVAALPSPLGRAVYSHTHANGLTIDKITVPLGVIGIIFESRPNVSADAAALCVKAGNAVILRGGREAISSNIAIVSVLASAAERAGLPQGCIQMIENTSRESSTGLMRLNRYLDVIIPRGGAGLIRAVMENATVPAIETGTGNCHVFVDASADLDAAERIVINAKTTRPSVCNSEEKLLAHRDIANEFLPRVLASLAEMGVEIRGDKQTCSIFPEARPVSEEDWDVEFLDMIIGVKVVEDIDEAIAHINAHSSHHSEAICTRDERNAEKFLALIDSAAVYVNASTRFTDGFEFGLGAEIGISTQKVHARGPMGLNELTSTKFIIRGDGQIR